MILCIINYEEVIALGSIRGLEWTFDTVSNIYEKIRPGYVDELYRTVFDYIPIRESSHVIEIGSGGGQATEPILKTGCKLTAIECGESFSELLKEKFKTYPNFSVITGKFEETELKPASYDFIFSASAFHWIPEEIGYKKVFSLLKSGGVFSRFANHPYRDKENKELSKKLDELYGKYYYPFHNKKQESPVEYSEGQARERALIAEKYGFKDIKYAIFHRTRELSPDEYVTLLGTYSDHIAMEKALREEFFHEIKKAIKEYGGIIKIYDTIDLQLAKKP